MLGPAYLFISYISYINISYIILILFMSSYLFGCDIALLMLMNNMGSLWKHKRFLCVSVQG